MYLSSCLGITDRPTWNIPGLKSTKEKMAATGDTPVIALPTAEWTTESVTLKELASSNDIPNVVRIVKGHYMTIGAPKFPLTRTHQDVFVHSVKSSYKVFAHSVKIRNGSRTGRFPYSLVSLEQRMSIPVTYQGWFEILSEDGKSAKPIESIHELAKIFPEKCLVRQGIKAYLANSEGKVDRERHRTVATGELLKLSGDVTIPAQSSSKSSSGKLKLLRCIDSKGESVYFAFDQRGLFAPVATRDGISGVHTIKDLLAKFRPPLTVKLIQGVFPKVDKSRFTGVVRLDWVYQDDTAFVCPITKESNLRMLPVPTDCPLKLVPASNIQQIKDSDVYKKIMIRCNRMIANYNNTIHLIMAIPEVVMKTKRNSQMAHQMYRQSLPSSRTQPGSRMTRSKSKEDMLMDEIDDLYQYVRDGGDPPKTKFTYDSDEESYWEEPEYETLDDFRARLVAIDTGAKVPPPLKYKPLDADKITLNGETNVVKSEQPPAQRPKPPTPPPRRYSLPPPESPKQAETPTVTAESPKTNGVPRPQNGTEAVVTIDGIPKGCSSTDPPPPLPNRVYQRSGSIPALLIRKSSVDVLTPAKINQNKTRMQRSKSRDTIGTTDSNSGSSGGRIGKDWMDLSDRSVRSRDTRSSGSNGRRKIQRKMQQLYL